MIYLQKQSFRANLKRIKRYQQGKQGLTIVHVKAFSTSISEHWMAESPSILFILS